MSLSAQTKDDQRRTEGRRARTYRALDVLVQSDALATLDPRGRGELSRLAETYSAVSLLDYCKGLCPQSKMSVCIQFYKYMKKRTKKKSGGTNQTKPNQINKQTSTKFYLALFNKRIKKLTKE